MFYCKTCNCLQYDYAKFPHRKHSIEDYGASDLLTEEDPIFDDVSNHEIIIFFTLNHYLNLNKKEQKPLDLNVLCSSDLLLVKKIIKKVIL